MTQAVLFCNVIDPSPFRKVGSKISSLASRAIARAINKSVATMTFAVSGACFLLHRQGKSQKVRTVDIGPQPAH